MTPVAHNSGILQRILSGGDADMPRRFQQGQLEIRRDVARPYYYVRLTLPTVDERKTRGRHFIGWVDEISRTEAQRLRTQLLEMANAHKVLLPAQVRFRELVRLFEEARLPQMGAGTAYRYRNQIKVHILPAFGDKRLCDIDRQVVETWLAGKQNLAWWTRDGLRCVLSAIFTAAREWKLWTGDNPATGARIGRKKEVREKRLLTAEQLRLILAAVSDRTRFMILVAALVGLRISEICGLKWGDVDIERGTLTVARRWYRGDLDEPKTEASKRVRELGPLVSEFARLYPGPQARDRFIFADGPTPVDERDILRYELRPALKRLEIYAPGMGWHAFRRMNLTLRQTVGGATPMEAQKQAGHTRLDTTFLYTLADAERERQQVGKMFEELMGGGATKQ